MMLAEIRQAEPWSAFNVLGLVVLAALVVGLIWLLTRTRPRE